MHKETKAGISLHVVIYLRSVIVLHLEILLKVVFCVMESYNHHILEVVPLMMNFFYTQITKSMFQCQGSNSPSAMSAFFRMSKYVMRGSFIC